MDSSIHDEAVTFIKKGKKLLIEKFANDLICPTEEHPISIFMAGSPGAGKTEFSKNLLKKVPGLKAVRIDADEIKEVIPQYNRKNSDEIQGASALGVEYLYDYVLKKKKSVILDGTFADYEKSCKNIVRSLKRGRIVEIYYLFQDPLIAWKFTKAREEVEGRFVPKEVFVDSLFKAKENVDKVKDEYGKAVKVHIVIKNFESNQENLYVDIDTIDTYLKITYDYKSLMEKL